LKNQNIENEKEKYSTKFNNIKLLKLKLNLLTKKTEFMNKSKYFNIEKLDN
jgi:hypothetical protein